MEDTEVTHTSSAEEPSYGDQSVNIGMKNRAPYVDVEPTNAVSYNSSL